MKYLIVEDDFGDVTDLKERLGKLEIEVTVLGDDDAPEWNKENQPSNFNAFDENEYSKPSRYS